MLTLLICESCTNQSIETQFVTTNVNNMSSYPSTQINSPDTPNAQVKKEQIQQIEYYDIKYSIGLIITDDNKRYDYGSPIYIYNQDGSIWYQFTNERVSNEVLEFGNDDLRPFRYQADEILLVFNCVGQDSLYYHVIVNEETKLKKFIRKDSEIFNFITWEEYILKSFAVSFDENKNPLRDKPNGQVINEKISLELPFHPKEIQGNWLKIKWVEKDKKESKFAWIEWKKDSTIIVNIFETA